MVKAELLVFIITKALKVASISCSEDWLGSTCALECHRLEAYLYLRELDDSVDHVAFSPHF